MNVLLQRHCARYIYVVPDGLRELMSDISREVIRSQPENTYLFIADYLDALMITRENARVAARLVQSITEIATTTTEFLQQTGMERADADHIVAIIQKAFKKHIQIQPGELPEIQSEEVEEANIISDIINEANISPEEGEEAALIIQRAFRQFKLRQQKEKQLLSGIIDWRAAARSAILLYRHTGVTVEEANRAATMIKAAYKGYYTRRLIKKLAEEGKILEHESFVGEEELESSPRSSITDKAVTIDYGTVIPHVDFDESKVAGTPPTEAASFSKSGTTSSSAIIASALEGILEAAFLQAQEKEVQLIQFEPDYLDSDGEALSEIREHGDHTGDHTGEHTDVSELAGTEDTAPEEAPAHEQLEAPPEEAPPEEAPPEEAPTEEQHTEEPAEPPEENA